MYIYIVYIYIHTYICIYINVCIHYELHHQSRICVMRLQHLKCCEYERADLSAPVGSARRDAEHAREENQKEVYIYIYIYIYIHTHIYAYIYICIHKQVIWVF